MNRQTIAMLAALCTAVSATAAPDISHAFPDKPLRLVVGFSPGGSNDIIARLLAPRMQETLGQQVVVENRPGAGGAIAADVVHKAEPDGHTLLLCSAGLFSIQPFLPQPMLVDTSQLTPITVLAMTPYVMITGQTNLVDTLPELMEHARRHPGTLNFASSGNGTASHLAGEMFVQKTGLQLLHVPYKGAGQAMTDVIAGRVSLMFDQLVSAQPQIQAGTVKALAVASKERLASLPDVPTAEEIAGLDDFDPVPWAGLCTSPGVSGDKVNVLHKAAVKALADPAIRARFHTDGLPIVANTPAEFRTLLIQDQEKWGRTIKQIRFE